MKSGFASIASDIKLAHSIFALPFAILGACTTALDALQGKVDLIAIPFKGLNALGLRTIQLVSKVTGLIAFTSQISQQCIRDNMAKDYISLPHVVMNHPVFELKSQKRLLCLLNEIIDRCLAFVCTTVQNYI